MSLNQKYTWLDFLKEHPEHKEKKTKRTSAEGKKAFDAAFKAFARKYLAERAEKMGIDVARAVKRREGHVFKLKEARKAGKKIRAKLAQKKIGGVDHAIAYLAKQQERMRAKGKAL